MLHRLDSPRYQVAAENEAEARKGAAQQSHAAAQDELRQAMVAAAAAACARVEPSKSRARELEVRATAVVVKDACNRSDGEALTYLPWSF